MHSTDRPPDKFRRYRERLKARGLRQIQLWVPDTTHPRFQDELRRQLTLVEHSEEDREALAFIECAADWSD